MAGIFKHPARVISGALGVAVRCAGNTGGDYPSAIYVDTFENPAATPTDVASCDLVVSVAASNDAAGADLTIVSAVEATLRTQPRSIAIAADAAQTENVTVTGKDQFGNAQTEVIAFNGAAVVQGTKVWSAITTIHQAQRSGAANIGAGLGTILGTSRRLMCVLQGVVFTTTNARKSGVRETTTPVKSTTTDVHGATFNTAIAVTKTYDLYYISDELR